MGSYSEVASRVWDLSVTNSILTGCWLARINTYNSSLLYAWIVFLCDVVFIMDALARASKKTSSHGSWISSSLFSFIVNACGSWTILTTLISAMKFVSFVPYHVLVILDLDFSGLYLVVCAFRVARLLQSGRIYANVIWTISKILENGGVFVEGKSRKQGRTSKKDCLKETKQKSPFLEEIKKLQAKEMEVKDKIVRCVF